MTLKLPIPSAESRLESKLPLGNKPDQVHHMAEGSKQEHELAFEKNSRDGALMLVDEHRWDCEDKMGTASQSFNTPQIAVVNSSPRTDQECKKEGKFLSAEDTLSTPDNSMSARITAKDTDYREDDTVQGTDLGSSLDVRFENRIELSGNYDIVSQMPSNWQGTTEQTNDKFVSETECLSHDNEYFTLSNSFEKPGCANEVNLSEKSSHGKLEHTSQTNETESHGLIYDFPESQSSHSSEGIPDDTCFHQNEIMTEGMAGSKGCLQERDIDSGSFAHNLLEDESRSSHVVDPVKRRSITQDGQ